MVLSIHKLQKELDNRKRRNFACVLKWSLGYDFGEDSTKSELVRLETSRKTEHCSGAECTFLLIVNIASLINSNCVSRVVLQYSGCVQFWVYRSCRKGVYLRRLDNSVEKTQFGLCAKAVTQLRL